MARPGWRRAALAVAAVVLLLCAGARAWRSLAPPPRRLVRAGAAATGEPQVLRFPVRTGPRLVEVVLVGTMHYNPHSVALAERVVRETAGPEGRGLHAVVIESCASRWNRTLEMQPEGSFLRGWLDNEFQAGTEAAARAGAMRTVLGDADIAETDAAIKAAVASTVRDLATPPRGWRNIAAVWRDNLAELDARAQDGGVDDGSGEAISMRDLADWRLMAFLPVSFFRYTLAILVKASLPGRVILLAVAGLLVWLGDGSMDTPADPMTVPEALGDMGVSFLEFVFVQRLFYSILGDRNQVLAENIMNECEAAVDVGQPTVVAIMGMAHANGVKRRLQELERARARDGAPAAVDPPPAPPPVAV